LPLRKVLLTAFCFLLVFTACGALPVKNPLRGRSGNYVTAADFTYKEHEFAAVISQETPSSCVVAFDFPNTVAGLEIVFQKDDAKINYKGLSFTFDRESMPPGAAANVAVTAIGAAMTGESLEIFRKDDNHIEIAGMTENGEFKLVAERKTGELIKLSVPAQELEIAFNNFRFLD
jgi:hypothetical protein